MSKSSDWNQFLFISRGGEEILLSSCRFTALVMPMAYISIPTAWAAWASEIVLWLSRLDSPSVTIMAMFLADARSPRPGENCSRISLMPPEVFV